MLHSQCHKLLFPNLPVPLSLTHQYQHHNHSPVLHFLNRRNNGNTLHVLSAIPPEASPVLITHLAQEFTITGTIQFPLFTATNETLQVASSVLLTGATTAFFFRTVVRRIKRVKELKFRSAGVNKSLNGLRAMQSNSIKVKAPPAPDQALLGAVIAGVIALILFNLTSNVDTALSHHTVSNNFSARQITITIRTMITGLCYLATFIYGFSSIGLLLYSGQLATNISFMGRSVTGKKIDKKIIEQPGIFSSSTIKNITSDDNKLSTPKEDQSQSKST
ncbi:hypothetical protein HN51_011657 [Arachis hypogaea]|uniref:Uncharacterized protein n=2 Tax=Arachis TaxID=3817 RepID=A0A445DY43_ARAHY|nr:uncharacterized protein LOC107478523 [Arachis duranensis]XP_025670348.1 uncharacterized protein LOC112770149 [Arachis hypogaea]QHO56995.1 uncharacterized protein DS421_3g78560 [Arachis hypogaea]RYR68120.1 hypothetical protein Ahy_A03g014592 [Arachis hypogaea]